MNPKIVLRWVLVLAVQALAVVFAISLFRHMDNKLLAGALAGVGFFLTGLGLWLYFFKRLAWKSLSVYVIGFYILVIVIPMVVVRWLHQDLPFEQVQILGFSGLEFHRISSRFYFMNLSATIIDLYRITNKKG